MRIGGWKEVYSGSALEEVAKMKATLEANGIPYRCKTKQRDDAPPLRAPARESLGRVGEQTSRAVMYYISVEKANVEKAAHLLSHR